MNTIELTAVTCNCGGQVRTDGRCERCEQQYEYAQHGDAVLVLPDLLDDLDD